MLVIAVIGILAASVFPMLRVYLEKSRDTARISHLGQLRTITQSYLQEVGRQPILSEVTGHEWCAWNPDTGSWWELSNYLNGGIVPVDPIDGNVVSPCHATGAQGTRIASKGIYGYMTWLDMPSSNVFFFVTRVESAQSATTWVTALMTTQSWIDALLQIHGKKWIAPNISVDRIHPSVNYWVYILGGTN